MKLRGLDIDDLLVLVMIADDISVSDIGRSLNLTQPAISQRLVKIRQFTGVLPAMRTNGRYLRPTTQGRILSKAATIALIFLIRAIPEAFDNIADERLVRYILSKEGDFPWLLQLTQV